MAPMAWQSSTAMGANGGSGGVGEGTTSSQGPGHGTEYTLQGMGMIVDRQTICYASSYLN